MLAIVESTETLKYCRENGLFSHYYACCSKAPIFFKNFAGKLGVDLIVVDVVLGANSACGNHYVGYVMWCVYCNLIVLESFRSRDKWCRDDTDCLHFALEWLAPTDYCLSYHTQYLYEIKITYRDLYSQGIGMEVWHAPTFSVV